jgi:hypothetical protein
VSLDGGANDLYAYITHQQSREHASTDIVVAQGASEHRHLARLGGGKLLSEPVRRGGRLGVALRSSVEVC